MNNAMQIVIQTVQLLMNDQIQMRLAGDEGGESVAIIITSF